MQDTHGSLSHPFFFQAEDGIRDPLVTGVQTCALPISGRWASWCTNPTRRATSCWDRSEERRVGKECRYRRGPEHEKKKAKTVAQRPAAKGRHRKHTSERSS